MSILARLALLFVIVPILELVLLIEIGQVVGLLPTVALVVFTGVTGAWLARAEGVRVFFQFQQELAAGRLPGQAMLDGISVLVGGAFLLTPGVLTDVVGFSLLLPFTRRWIQRQVRRRLERGMADGTIRVVTMGGGGGFGFDGAAETGTTRGRAGTRPGASETAGEVDVDRVDPSKEIVIESDEG